MTNAFWGIVPSDTFLYKMEIEFTRLRIENWLHHDVFSFQWWLLLFILIIPWFIWWIYVDRKRILDISLFGAIVLIISSFSDSILSELGLWSYTYELLPVWPRLITADFTILPVTYMFLYQYFRNWKHFILAMIVMSAVFAFAGEPLLIWLKIYNLHNWKHIYSFPIYIALGIFVRYIIEILLLHQKGNRIGF